MSIALESFDLVVFAGMNVGRAAGVEDDVRQLQVNCPVVRRRDDKPG